MTAKESAKMARLEAENKRLREMVDKQMEIYRDQAWELVGLRTKLDLVVAALRSCDE
jgi:hypothetical protein